MSSHLSRKADRTAVYVPPSFCQYPGAPACNQGMAIGNSGMNLNYFEPPSPPTPQPMQYGGCNSMMPMIDEDYGYYAKNSEISLDIRNTAQPPLMDIAPRGNLPGFSFF